ncbi:hypothetical protein ACFSFZ_20440 [Mixta tenebrionis]|uniref:Tum protein n=1 Tax=Mixta tenebrionis TaxID=2562439 RepID=A0A506V6N0_9GAMM|nr:MULTISPECIES: hypothetical protein [Mixta]QHM74096.1 hypothetical protein C7M52_00017 [Mixta theicola]TPW41072.1 hypothetical protein FKM52_16410 [Mixta tenebrionis]
MDLQEQVMLERVELIARLTTQGSCRERDREIALALIAEIAGKGGVKSNQLSAALSALSADK